jgi:hypothetical protein
MTRKWRILKRAKSRPYLPSVPSSLNIPAVLPFSRHGILALVESFPPLYLHARISLIAA